MYLNFYCLTLYVDSKSKLWRAVRDLMIHIAHAGSVLAHENQTRPLQLENPARLDQGGFLLQKLMNGLAG